MPSSALRSVNARYPKSPKSSKASKAEIWYKIGTEFLPRVRESTFAPQLVSQSSGGGQDPTYSSPLQPPVDQASPHLADSIRWIDRCRAALAGAPVRLRRQDQLALDTDWTCLYHSYMNNAVASAMIQAAHRVEARLEEALAGVGLSIAKFETLSILVSQDRPISLSELAAKLVCVRSNVTQLVDRLETEGLVKRADDPADRRAVLAEVTALGRKRQAAGTPVVNAVLQDVANKLAAVDSQKLKRALDAIQ